MLNSLVVDGAPPLATLRKLCDMLSTRGKTRTGGGAGYIPGADRTIRQYIVSYRYTHDVHLVRLTEESYSPVGNKTWAPYHV